MLAAKTTELESAIASKPDQVPKRQTRVNPVDAPGGQAISSGG